MNFKKAESLSVVLWFVAAGTWFFWELEEEMTEREKKERVKFRLSVVRYYLEKLEKEILLAAEGKFMEKLLRLSGGRQGLDLYAKKDYGEALPFISEAAEGGHKDGMAVLGAMYLFGRGVQNDGAKAKYWLGVGGKQRAGGRSVNPWHHVRDWARGNKEHSCHRLPCHRLRTLS